MVKKQKSNKCGLGIAIIIVLILICSSFIYYKMPKRVCHTIERIEKVELEATCSEDFEYITILPIEDTEYIHENTKLEPRFNTEKEEGDDSKPEVIMVFGVCNKCNLITMTNIIKTDNLPQSLEELEKSLNKNK